MHSVYAASIVLMIMQAHPVFQIMVQVETLMEKLEMGLVTRFNVPCIYKDAVTRAISWPLADIGMQAISELLLAKEALM